jgi:hypothetical protein
MSFAGLLINSLTVKRWTNGIADTYGNPTKTAVVPDPYIGAPCRISYPRGRQVQQGTEVVPVDAVLFTEILTVTEADKAEVDGVLYDILFVADLQNGTADHHLEISLARVKP